jgi:cysteine synthase A
MQVAQQMREQALTGSIVTLLCDAGDRYLQTYHDPQWVAQTLGDTDVYQKEIAALMRS